MGLQVKTGTGFDYVTPSNLLPVASSDVATGKTEFLDQIRNLRVAQAKRVLGSGFGSTIDTTYIYTTNVSGTGAVAASSGVASLTTGATANSTASLVTKGKIRYLSGRANVFRAIVRFGDTGTANNLREFGIQSDSNNGFYFRLSATTFQVVALKGGVANAVSSGSFNGNGNSSGGTYTLDTNFHSFDIIYTNSSIRFLIDDMPIHVLRPTSTSLTSSMVGTLYANNANSGGGTANVTLDMLNWSGSMMGDAVNNPNFYNINATAETRTLKGGGGTLQSISIGRAGGANAALTIYDNTAGSGTVIAIFDMTKDSAIGNHVFGIDGVNFYNGLTYVSSGTWTAGSATLFWD